jgi:hypothetical protein
MGPLSEIHTHIAPFFYMTFALPNLDDFSSCLLISLFLKNTEILL